jgi:acyl-CoA dehydrogenase
MGLLLFVLYLGFSLTVLYRAFSPRVWEIGSAIYLILATFMVGLPWFSGLFLWLIVAAIVVVLRVESVRCFISDYVFARAAKSMPKLSKTEEEALNSGDVWLEESIFIGEPDWEKLASIKVDLTEEEEAFLNNETETLCAMLNDWDIVLRRDLPTDVWAYMKEKGFFALVIAKKYGGKGFSARAHSDIVVKIASRSGSAAVTAMVPNSLGPGELLQHYGTDQQKSYYLPRLAKGIEIPCFALTEPGAGSDATSIESQAIVTHKKIDGKLILGLELTLNKRWITLAPVATLVGLAVNLKDPNGLLNGEGEEGITCLLIPHDTPNLEIGNRHLPGEQAFMNGTIRGRDIFVPIDSIIGGQKKAGHGWQMLVECLSIGRSISLPALAYASTSVSYVTTGAFARIRRQFNVDIAQFEGVQEKLAEIAGLNYLVNATRMLTLAAVYEDKKPSVASAIAKYFNSEFSRHVLNNAMDVHGGRTVVMGPRNYLAGAYQGIPISITVEGANIMTRNLLIFGQGSMACHPYVRDEFYAIAKQDKKAFRGLFWKHAYYFIRNFAKTVCTVWTGGRFIKVPSSPLKREYQRLSRLSYAFSWLADLSLMTLGGDLKRKERLSARLADGMSYLYMAMAALRNCQDSSEDDEVHAKWAVTYCFYHAQKSLISLCNNFPIRFVGVFARCVAFPWGQSMPYPDDAMERKLATLMSTNNEYRSKTLKALYLSEDTHQPIERVEHAFQLMLKYSDLYKKVTDLKRCKWGSLKSMLAEKVKNNELTAVEMENLLSVEQARWDAIQVDEFTKDSLKKTVFASVIDDIPSPLD